MRKRIFAIWSILLVLVVSIAVLVQGCEGCGGGGGGGGEEEQCTIEVKATLDGSPWTGAVNYTLTGQGAAAAPITGTSVEKSFTVDCGSWTCAYVSGGPAGASSVNITPTATQTVSAGSTITFTLNFVGGGGGGEGEGGGGEGGGEGEGGEGGEGGDGGEGGGGGVGLDHFLTYRVTGAESVGQVVSLMDQFVNITTTVRDAWDFCNPAEKEEYNGEVTEIENPDHHLTLYVFDYTDLHKWSVEVENQFGRQTLEVYGPLGLLVPTQKLVPGDHQPPVGLDHFLCYDVYPGPTPLTVPILVKDEFHVTDSGSVIVGVPFMLAVPAQKTDATGMVTEIQNPEAHLVFYHIPGAVVSYPEVQVADQFLEQNLTLGEPAWMLGVPSLKLDFEALGPYEPY